MIARRSKKKPTPYRSIYLKLKNKRQKPKHAAQKKQDKTTWIVSRLPSVLVLGVAVILALNITTTACTLQQTSGAMPGTTINHKTLEKPNTRMMVITGYCACRQCVGEWYTDNPVKYGASGRQLISGYSVATNSLPMGTIITIDGQEYRVDDRGTTGIDIYYDTHAGACSQGYSVKEITIRGANNG